MMESSFFFLSFVVFRSTCSSLSHHLLLTSFVHNFFFLPSMLPSFLPSCLLSFLFTIVPFSLFSLNSILSYVCFFPPSLLSTFLPQLLPFFIQPKNGAFFLLARSNVTTTSNYFSRKIKIFIQYTRTNPCTWFNVVLRLLSSGLKGTALCLYS